jgi:hypothetical protein
MILGPYEVHLFRDTGWPRLRLWFHRTPPVTDVERFLYGGNWEPAYVWQFKVMSWWTLYVARRVRRR